MWDIRTGDRIADVVQGLHEGGVTCVQYDPSNAAHVLTNGRDHSLNLIDLRTSGVVSTFRHPAFRTTHSWSACAMSPNGAFAASVSGTTGQVFVWQTTNHSSGDEGNLVAMLDGHTTCGAAGIAWGSCGDKQVASVDRMGRLILWS